MDFTKLSLLTSRMFGYRFFKKFPQWKHLDTGKMSFISNVIKQFHLEFINAVCSERYGVDLPLKLGKIYITAYKAAPYPNFSAFKKDGFISKFLNLHSDGYNCRISYSNHNRRYRVKDRLVWEFSPEKSFKKAASVAFAENHTLFEKSTDRHKVFYTGLDLDMVESSEKRIEKFLVTYDEFQLS